VFNVSGYRLASGGEVFKTVLLGAFLFEGADEALAQPVLLGPVWRVWRVGRDGLLREAAVAQESTVGSRAED